MTQDTEILGELYALLNVVGVTSVITGKLYTVNKPVGSKLEDIAINTLTNTPTNNEILNTGIINVNIFANMLTDHRAPTTRLKVLNDAIFEALGTVNGIKHYGRLNFKIRGQKTFRDKPDKTMYFSNIRIEYSFKN